MTMSGRGAVAPMQQEAVVAPFVAKTYRMVDDPSTDAVIAWGPANNSFVVADPFALARTLLPAYFNHRNFSSFVRQLNTYGFRKVDPDRWEFAHVSFLRGQTHLLHRVVRKRNGGRRDAGGSSGNVADEEGTRLSMEVVRLRREHKANQELLEAMSRRVQEMERRPKRMLALILAKAAGDPEVLRRVLRLAGAGGGGRDDDGVGGSSNSAKTEDTAAGRSARMFPDADSDRGQLGSGSGDGDGAAGRRTHGVLGGGEGGFDYTRFLTGGGRGGGAPLMPPCTFSADSTYWRLC